MAISPSKVGRERISGWEVVFSPDRDGNASGPAIGIAGPCRNREGVDDGLEPASHSPASQIGLPCDSLGNATQHRHLAPCRPNSRKSLRCGRVFRSTSARRSSPPLEPPGRFQPDHPVDHLGRISLPDLSVLNRAGERPIQSRRGPRRRGETQRRREVLTVHSSLSEPRRRGSASGAGETSRVALASLSALKLHSASCAIV